jgi:hypothetical protein
MAQVPMDKLFTVDWAAVFVPVLGLPEIVVRGTIMYLILFSILRFLGRRQAGHFGPADLLVIVVIADAAQNALGAEYRSIPEGALLAATIVGWDYALDWAAWRFPALRPLLKAPPLTLVENGKILRANLRAEMLSREELMSQLREEGIDDLKKVKRARLEGERAFERHQSRLTFFTSPWGSSTDPFGVFRALVLVSLGQGREPLENLLRRASEGARDLDRRHRPPQPVPERRIVDVGPRLAGADCSSSRVFACALQALLWLGHPRAFLGSGLAALGNGCSSPWSVMAPGNSPRFSMILASSGFGSSTGLRPVRSPSMATRIRAFSQCVSAWPPGRPSFSHI